MEFVEPEVMLKHAEDSMAYINSCDLFNDPKYQKLREQWCAGLFGVGYKLYVRGSDVAVNTAEARQDVDFFLRTGNKAWA